MYAGNNYVSFGNKMASFMWQSMLSRMLLSEGHLVHNDFGPVAGLKVLDLWTIPIQKLT